MRNNDPTKSELLPVEYKPLLLDKDRLTFNLTVYHEHRGDKPHTLSRNWSELLEFMDEPYTRRLRAEEDWKPIDLGHLKPSQIGTIVIENITGRARLVNPTEEEKKADAAKVIELSFTGSSEDAWLVKPGAPFFGQSNHIQRLQIRSQQGVADYRLHLITK